MLMGLAGCDARTEATPVSPTMPPHVASFDAGVVLAGRTGYLCVPLIQVGLRSDAQVVSVSSSCECLRPQLIEYAVSSTSHAPAILLEYAGEIAPEDFEGDKVRTTCRLGVVIELVLSDGDLHEFTVNLLHTSIAGEGAI